MPGLIASNVPLKLGALNTKTDPRWVVPGDLVSARNIIFDAWPKLKKRNGYQKIATASLLEAGNASSATAGAQLVSFKNQLLSGSGLEAYSYAASSMIDKGILESMTVSARAVRRDAYSQSTVDSAVHPSGGISVYTWETTAGGAQYAVHDTATGQPILAGAQISVGAVKPKPLVIGNYVVVVYYDTTVNHIRYFAVPVAAPTTIVNAATDFATNPATSALFDAAVIGGALFLGYANNAGSNKITLKYLTAALVVSAATVPVTSEAINTCCTVFGDIQGNVWMGFYDGASHIKAFAYDSTLTTLVAGFVIVDNAVSATRNIAGTGGTQAGIAFASLVYEETGSAAYNTAIGAGTVIVDATGAPTLSSATGSISGGSLAAGTYFYKISAIGGSGTGGETAGSNERSAVVASGSSGSVALAWTAYTNAPTGYRVYRGTATGAESVYYLPGNVTSFTDTGAATAGSAAPLLRGNYTIGNSGSVVQRSVGLASKPFFYGGRVHCLAAYQSTLQSTYFLLSGPLVPTTVVAKIAPSLGAGLTAKSILPEMNNPSSGVYSCAYLQADQLTSIGGNVFTQAGVMQGTFDFTQPQTAVELSDDLHLTGGILSMYDGAQVCEHGFHLYPENLAFTAGGSGAITGTYQACATYEWMDAQGLLHQSAPSPVVSVAASSAAYFDYTVQSLRLTSKNTPVSVVFWRTLALGTVFYRVSSISSPNINTTSADTVSAPSHGDTAADTALAGNAQLYSNPDNVLAEVPNIAAPAPLHVWRYRNRVALIPAENSYQWTFSKAFVAGVPIEFNNQQLYQSVSQDGGPLTCGIEMDEKNILFTAKRIYYVIGDGPAPNGTSPDYGSSPQNIPSDVGCSNRRSLVLTPMGVMFQSAKGIYLLGRDLSVQYVGAAVEAFNSLTITAAQLVPNSRRVIFFTASGTALVYDYFTQKWAVFTNHISADATVFGGLVTYVQPGGAIMQETPGQFTDNGAPILIGAQTSILSFAGLSGFQRVYRFGIRGDYRSAHVLSVSVAYDDSPAPSQVQSVNAGTLLGTASAGGVTTGDMDSPGDGDFPAYEFVIKCKQQKCSSLQITIQETQPAAPFGEGLSLSGITFLVGGLKRLHPVPALRSI